MLTVMDPGTVTPVSRGRLGAARPSRFSLTLADLITAIQDVVGPGNDRLVVATVRHLLEIRRLMEHGAGTLRRPPPRREKRWSHMVTGGVERSRDLSQISLYKLF